MCTTMAAEGGLRLREPTREELHAGLGGLHLPRATKALPRAETVCKFCGVSYLIFSEVRALERKLEQASADGAAAREELRKCSERNTEAELEAERRKAREHGAQAEALAAKLEAIQATHQRELERQRALQKAYRVKIERGVDRTKHRASQMALEISKLQNDKNRLLEAVRRGIDQARSETEAQVRQVAAVATQQLERQARLKEQENHDRTASLQLELTSLARDLDDGKRALSGLEAAKEALQGRVQALEQELSKAVEEAKRRGRKHAEELAALSTEHDRRRSEWDTERTALQDASRHFDSQLEEKDGAMAALRARTDKAEGSLRELYTESEQKNQRLRCVQEEADTQKARAEELQGRLEQATKTQANLEKQLQEDLASREAAASERIRDLEGQVTHADEKYAAVARELEETCKAFQGKEEELKVQLETQQERRKTDREQYEAALDEAQARLDATQLALEKAKASQEELQERLHALAQRNLKAESSALAELRSALKAAQEQLRNSEMDAEQHRVEAKRRQDTINKLLSLEALQAGKLKEVQEQLAVTKAQVLEREDFLASFRADQAVKAAEIQRLQTTIGQMQAQLGNVSLVTRELESTVQDLREELSDRERTLASVEEAKAKLQQQQQQQQEELQVARNSSNNNSNNQESVEGLERHMIKLSEALRQKDAEIRVLQTTVHRQCMERTQMMMAARNHR